MQDSAGIKRHNKSFIRKVLLQGQPYSKQQIARQTGLSVASCNTYLNEMEETGEVVGEKRKSHEVGRSSVFYRLNEEYESFVCVYFELIQGVKSMTTTVLSQRGRSVSGKSTSLLFCRPKQLRMSLPVFCSSFPIPAKLWWAHPVLRKTG